MLQAMVKEAKMDDEVHALKIPDYKVIKKLGRGVWGRSIWCSINGTERKQH